MKVTTVTPMKRGLKVSPVYYPESYNRYPDEKGTESITSLSIQPLPR